MKVSRGPTGVESGPEYFTSGCTRGGGCVVGPTRKIVRGKFLGSHKG